MSKPSNTLESFLNNQSSSCYRSLTEKRNRKKREREEEERQRLFKLVEEEYRYKSDTYDSAEQAKPASTFEPLKDHSSFIEDEDGVVDVDDSKRRDTMNTNTGMYIRTLYIAMWNSQGTWKSVPKFIL